MLNQSKSHGNSKTLERNGTMQQLTTMNKVELDPNSQIENLKKALFIDPINKVNLLNNIRRTGNFNINKQTPPIYVILPLSRAKKLWDTLIFLMIVYGLIIIPVDMGWNLECFTANDGQAFKTLYLISTIFFFLDLLLSTVTAVLDEKNNYIYNVEQIIVSYAKGWFLIDLISAMPFDRIIAFQNSDCFQSYIAPAKRLMFLSMFRVFKMGKFFAMLERDFSRYSLYIRFIKLFGFILFFAHIVGNLFVGNSPTFSGVVFKDCSGSPSNSPENLACSKQLMSTKFMSIYFYCVYFGMVSSFGNDSIVRENFEMITLMCVTVITTVTNASIYGNAAVMLNSVGFGVSPILRAKLDVMKEYMGFMKFDERFIEQIEEYHVNIWLKQRNMMYSANFLGDMSMALQKILLLEQWRKTFFLDSKFIPLVSQSFMLEMIPLFKPKIFMNNDIIITEGDSAKEVYFIPKTGICQVKIGGTYVSQMTNGDYFGEISVFLRSNRRTATVVCLKDSDFLLLEGHIFEKLLMDFPEDYDVIRKCAISRLLDSMKLYPSSLFAKLVPNNNIKDYMFRKVIYLNNEEEDSLTEDKKKKMLIDGSMFNHKIENVTENIRAVKKEMEEMMAYMTGLNIQ